MREENGILRQNSVFEFRRITNNRLILKNGYFDFSKISGLRVISGDILVKYRTEAGLTQKQLALRLGCTRHSIQNWECDVCAMPLSLLIRTAGLKNTSKCEVLCELNRAQCKFSMGSKEPVLLPYSLRDLYSHELVNSYPIADGRLYSVLSKKSNCRKVESAFLRTFFLFKRINKIRFPLTRIVKLWINENVDLLTPLSILFVTEGCMYTHGTVNCLVFVNNSKLLHNILVDSAYYAFGIVPSAYFVERSRYPKNSTYLTSYVSMKHTRMANAIIKEVKNVKTSPHDTETKEQFLSSIQPDLTFILNKNRKERALALALFIATEGSVYLSHRFGVVYPVVEIGCTNPTIILFLEKLSRSLDLNFKKQKSKITWSGLKGVRVRGISAAITLLKLGCLIDDIDITSKSRYHEGSTKKELLLSILEFHRRQKSNRDRPPISTNKVNNQISKILKNKEFKSASWYLRFFSKNKKIMRWINNESCSAV